MRSNVVMAGLRPGHPRLWTACPRHCPARFRHAMIAQGVEKDIRTMIIRAVAALLLHASLHPRAFAANAAAPSIPSSPLSRARPRPRASRRTCCPRRSAASPIDQAVLSFDRRQRGTFRKTFEEYASTRVTARPHQDRQARCCSVTPRCCRASSSASACRRKSSSRSGGWRPTSAPATWASCR